MNRIAVYAGSFDPPTNGHLDVVRRVQPLFDKIYMLVADNSRKKTLFTADERVELLVGALAERIPLGSFEVRPWTGLVVDFCKEIGAKVLIRGLRAVSDFENEFQMATMNRRLDPTVETLHVMTDEQYFFLSSSLVKELARHKTNLNNLVPQNVMEALKKKGIAK